jgi:hypothetical protein
MNKFKSENNGSKAKASIGFWLKITDNAQIFSVTQKDKNIPGTGRFWYGTVLIFRETVSD